MFKVIASVGLNVRSGAGTTFPKVGFLKFGDTVEVIGFMDNWAQIGINRWVSYAYLEKMPDIPPWPFPTVPIEPGTSDLVKIRENQYIVEWVNKKTKHPLYEVKDITID
jgi:hypothetical protein